MSTVLQKLAARERDSEVAARHAYLKLVKQLAEGVDDPTLEEVEVILDAADKSTAELREDVRKRQSRDELRAQVAAGAEARQRQLEIEQSKREWTAELAKAQQIYNDRLASVHWETIDCARVAQLGYEASHRIQRLCEDPVLKQKLTDNRRKLDALDNAIEDQKERVSRIQTMIHSEEARGANRSDGPNAGELERLRSRLSEAQRQLDVFHDKQPDLLAEQRELLAAAQDA